MMSEYMVGKWERERQKDLCAVERVRSEESKAMRKWLT